MALCFGFAGCYTSGIAISSLPSFGGSDRRARCMSTPVCASVKTWTSSQQRCGRRCWWLGAATQRPCVAQARYTSEPACALFMFLACCCLQQEEVAQLLEPEQVFLGRASLVAQAEAQEEKRIPREAEDAALDAPTVSMEDRCYRCEGCGRFASTSTHTHTFSTAILAQGPSAVTAFAASRQRPASHPEALQRSLPGPCASAASVGRQSWRRPCSRLCERRAAAIGWRRAPAAPSVPLPEFRRLLQCGAGWCVVVALWRWLAPVVRLQRRRRHPQSRRRHRETEEGGGFETGRQDVGRMAEVAIVVVAAAEGRGMLQRTESGGGRRGRGMDECYPLDGCQRQWRRLICSVGGSAGGIGHCDRRGAIR